MSFERAIVIANSADNRPRIHTKPQGPLVPPTYPPQVSGDGAYDDFDKDALFVVADIITRDQPGVFAEIESLVANAGGRILATQGYEINDRYRVETLIRIASGSLTSLQFHFSRRFDHWKLTTLPARPLWSFTACWPVRLHNDESQHQTATTMAEYGLSLVFHANLTVMSAQSGCPILIQRGVYSTPPGLPISQLDVIAEDLAMRFGGSADFVPGLELIPAKVF